MPDTHFVYGDNLEELGLDDNRYITYDMRFMITNNVIDPKVYQITKIIDTAPQGVIKYSYKQDEYDSVRDNRELRICNYYNDSGESLVSQYVSSEPDIEKTSEIHCMIIDEDGELAVSQEENLVLHINDYSYFEVSFSDVEVKPKWHIELVNDGTLNDEYYEGLLQLDEPFKNVISIRPSRAKSLIGKKFILSVSDINGEYYSSIELEVA